ncbi:hypothetical protein [Peribacillus butanolivorans]
MDIFLRNIDPIAVKKFDEIAKKKSISRQELLKSVIDTQPLFVDMTKDYR